MSLKRKPISEETRRRLSESHKGIRLSEEAKRKVGLASIGRKPSPEKINKLKETYRKKAFARFWSNVKIGDFSECWEYQASKDNYGYGTAKYAGRLMLTHRIMWSLCFGEIPPKMCVLHKCDNPPCVNPYHLFLGTRADNIRDKVAKNRQAKGGKIHRTKLNTSQVIEIRELHKKSYPMCRIAKLFDVSSTAISYVIKGKTWKYV